MFYSIKIGRAQLRICLSGIWICGNSPGGKMNQQEFEPAEKLSTAFCKTHVVLTCYAIYKVLNIFQAAKAPFSHQQYICFSKLAQISIVTLPQWNRLLLNIVCWQLSKMGKGLLESIIRGKGGDLLKEFPYHEHDFIE